MPTLARAKPAVSVVEPSNGCGQGYLAPQFIAGLPAPPKHIVRRRVIPARAGTSNPKFSVAFSDNNDNSVSCSSKISPIKGPRKTEKIWCPQISAKISEIGVPRFTANSLWKTRLTFSGNIHLLKIVCSSTGCV
jgi:hypothetical protein